MTDHLQLKKDLFRKCSEHVEARIRAIKAALDSVYQSKLEETKSSAGDKFETGRAMMQMEEEKLKTQMHRAKSDLEVLSAIANRIAYDQIGPGNLVTTSQGTYFIAIGIGKVDIGGVVYYCISTESPIGARLKGKVVGDLIEFNGRRIDILEIS
jgi:transcription elongation GreA/GreB family factor